MSNPLATLLATRDWLLADGATGTNLFAMGLEAGEAPELWNESEPGKVRALYDGAIVAGSDLFLTNSFGGNAARLQLHDAAARAFELNRIAAEIAREAADAAGRPVVVAGSMGPTGEIMAPLGPLTVAAAADLFEEQARGLLAGGVDVLWVETISSAEEFEAAATGIARTGAPWCGTMSFDTNGRTMMGLTAADMVGLVSRLPAKPLAFGANCGVGASDLLRTVLGFALAHPDLPLIAKGNAGIPKFHDGHIHYDGTPELMADYAVLARDCGARIIGGCCGTTPAHLVAMRAALEATPAGPRPEPAEIEARLGAFSSASDGSDGAPAGRERRRRRS
jgi:5-methyltetrahydrofolate--homocysteine methyltransferase